MIPYVLIFFYASFLFFKRKRDYDNLLSITYLIIIILFSGFRDMIGGYDIYIYGDIFESKKFEYPALEKGYLLYNNVLSFFSNDRQFLFFVTSLLIGVLHYLIIQKFSPVLSFSLFILFCKFYLMSFVYLRQGLAMGIIWLSIPYIQKRKFLIFLLLSFLAYSFHKSSIIFLPTYFLYNIKIKNKQLIIILGVMLFISLTPLKIIFSPLISRIKEESFSFEYPLNYFYIIEILLILFTMLKYNANDNDEKLNFIRNGLFLYLLTTCIGLNNSTFIRLNWYFLIFLCLYLPYVYISIKNLKIKNLAKKLIYCYFALLFLRLLLIWDGGDFLPYKSIFQNFERHGRWEYLEYK